MASTPSCSPICSKATNRARSGSVRVAENLRRTWVCCELRKAICIVLPCARPVDRAEVTLFEDGGAKGRPNIDAPPAPKPPDPKPKDRSNDREGTAHRRLRRTQTPRIRKKR